MKGYIVIPQDNTGKYLGPPTHVMGVSAVDAGNDFLRHFKSRYPEETTDKLTVIPDKHALNFEVGVRTERFAHT